MTLCDIHFHKNAEHRGGDFTTFAGNGDGRGYGTGFLYDGRLSAAELALRQRPVGSNTGDELIPGDTIEIHFVFSTVSGGRDRGTALEISSGMKYPVIPTKSANAQAVKK
ncbi:delta-class carbonic anhydrase [Roseibium aggregatum]|nr:delta-class carbonic anhydrase [Roseibium aggregatum]